MIRPGRRRPDREAAALREKIPYDPARQIPVVRSSICTGEKAAGFRDRESGRFTEVMLVRGPRDEQRFREIYGLDEVKKEY
jgi:hypothetical protein